MRDKIFTGATSNKGGKGDATGMIPSDLVKVCRELLFLLLFLLSPAATQAAPRLMPNFPPSPPLHSLPDSRLLFHEA